VLVTILPCFAPALSLRVSIRHPQWAVASDQGVIVAPCGASRAYNSVGALLANAGQINAVCIATPVHLGASQTVAAARAGKQVLIEKPTAISTSECETMIGACAKCGVQLTVYYHQHFNARDQMFRDLVQRDAVGTITMAEARQAFLCFRSDGANDGLAELSDRAHSSAQRRAQ
jgi:predicted dehydrogenase